MIEMVKRILLIIAAFVSWLQTPVIEPGEYCDEEGCRMYDEEGEPVTGWQKTDDGFVYYDPETGLKCFGSAVIDGTAFDFNEDTGLLDLHAVWISADSFIHGYKEVQKYIMIHDTEGSGAPADVAEWMKVSRQGAVASHFIIGRDGSLVQCGHLDDILHHAGWGGPGNYDGIFGTGNNDGLGNGDDLVGTEPLYGYTSYGMNSYSIGIELVHIGGQDYPEAQLETLDRVITYIDLYYGFEAQIIRHRDWRPSNSDTDINFEPYFANYTDHRKHK